MATTITRSPVYPEDKAMGNAYRPGADHFLFVDGVKIGGTYWAGANPAGKRWTSWGVGGLSQHHKTREAAARVEAATGHAGVFRSFERVGS